MPELIIRRDGEETRVRFEGSPLLNDVLATEGLALAQPCGGRGRCGKCRVELSGAVSPPNEAELRFDSRLVCQAVLLGDCEATLPVSRQMKQIQMDGDLSGGVLRPMPGQYGAAVDLGTTTLALKLYRLSDGRLVGSAGAPNPQGQTAADVMGRIGAALAGGLSRLERQVQQAILGLLHTACREAGVLPADVPSMVVAGNTTMLYLLTGTSPLSLSRAPFDAEDLFGRTVSLMDRQVYLPPCMDAFVGADITCAVLASGICRREQTALLIDVGTNGEIALWKDGTLLVSSTAAGPAFEGAGIHMGCGSVPGAVDGVWAEDGRLKAHTIGGAPAAGVCGSGLIDAVAALLDLGLVEDSGATDEERLYLTEGVYLIPADIRSVQLAKAAVAAGIRTLMHQAGVSAEDIHALYLAGGFGSHLDIASAARIGLFPRELAGRVKVIGNAALSGAAELLLDTSRLAALSQIAARSRHVSLGGNPWFNEAYMEEMLFPEIA